LLQVSKLPFFLMCRGVILWIKCFFGLIGLVVYIVSAGLFESPFAESFDCLKRGLCALHVIFLDVIKPL
jgi:hypothetical protein